VAVVAVAEVAAAAVDDEVVVVVEYGEVVVVAVDVEVVVAVVVVVVVAVVVDGEVVVVVAAADEVVAVVVVVRTVDIAVEAVEAGLKSLAVGYLELLAAVVLQMVVAVGILLAGMEVLPAAVSVAAKEVEGTPCHQADC